MHRLRNRKKSGKEEKAKDDSATGGSSSSKSAFKRNKSQPPPTNRQQIDLTQALPSSDDFRTSLLMPNLEKRFSVLREQQEKEQQQKRNNAAAAAAAAAAGPGVNGIGYGALASGALSGLDDENGVVYRPPYGNSGGLQDIAETASLSGSIQSARNSGSDDSFIGVMSRPRPAEGNVLFGGRQKVFKISTVGTGPGDAAASPISPREARNYGGRALYSDDLPSGDRRGRGRYRDEEDERSVSPLGLYNRDRNTTSSTDSANPVSMSRSSTAATSVTSHSTQSVSSPAMSKPRRPLYAQALDNDLPLEDSFSDRKAEIIANANIKPRAMSPIPGMYPEEVYNRREFSPPAPLSKSGSNSRPLSPDDSRGRSLSPANQNNRFHVPHPGATASIASNLSGPIRKQSTDDYHQPKKNDTASLASFDFGLGNTSSSNDTTNKPSNTVTNNSGLPTPLSPDEEFHLGPQKPVLSGVSREPTPLPSPNPIPSPQKSEDYEDFKLRDDRSSYESNFIDPQFASNHSAKPSVDQTNQQSMLFDGQRSSASSDSDYGYKPAPLPKDRQPSPLYRTEPQVHDSPTLPAQGGLSSMIRQHFRSASGASSIYPASILPKQTDDASWDTNEWENCEPEPEPEEASKPKLTLAELKKRDAEERMMRNEPFELSRRQTTESERSNDEWENELAQRKRAVQMKLQGQLSGRNSPAPGHEMEVTRESPFKASTGLSGMLKSNKNGAPSSGDSKAMKMLGMSGSQSAGMKQLSRKASQEDYRQNLPMGGRMRAPSDPRPPPLQTRGPPSSQGGLAPGRMMAPPISPPADKPMGQPRKGPGHIPISALQQKFEEGSQRDERRPGPGPGGPAPTPPHALPSPADRRRNRRPQGPQGADDDLRPPHERPPHDRQHDASRGRPLNGMPSKDQLREQPPRVGPGLPKGPKQPSPPRIPNGRKRSDEDFRPADLRPAPLANTMSSDPMARRISPPKDDLREAMARGQSSAAVVDPVAEERNRLAAKKAAQQTLAPMENVQSRFSMEEPPVSKSFAGRVRSNSRAAKRPNDLEKELAPPPPPIQTVPPPQLSVTTHGMYQLNSASNTSTTLASSALASPATTITTQSSGGGGNLTLADVTGISPGSSPGFQSAGPAFQSREGKKGKVRKIDISEPKLFHTTSTMPASNLMNAGPKAVAPPVVLSHERSSPPRPRRGTQGNGGRPMSNEEEKPSRPAYMGHRLKKSLSDSNGLAERAKVSIPHSNSHQNLGEVSHPSWPTFENSNMPGGMI